VSQTRHIEHLELNLSHGLIIFTGETGAGKSIIIDAVETLMGGRAESVQVRGGEERADIEAVFQITEPSSTEIQSILQREELQDDQDFLTLARSPSQRQKHRA
jgi:DNA repair protein RecN (Recombination protein N)